VGGLLTELVKEKIQRSGVLAIGQKLKIDLFSALLAQDVEVLDKLDPYEIRGLVQTSPTVCEETYIALALIRDKHNPNTKPNSYNRNS